jgi:molybdopterin synthase sulfur carrier subunit
MRILAFGIAKDIVGGKQIDLDLEHVETVGALRRHLDTLYPRLLQLSSYVIAVNDEYADENISLDQKDEVAIIPPVSGG